MYLIINMHHGATPLLSSHMDPFITMKTTMECNGYQHSQSVYVTHSQHRVLLTLIHFTDSVWLDFARCQISVDDTETSQTII